MEKAYSLIRQLTEQNAKHKKKGWRLGDRTPEAHIRSAAEEVVELMSAFTSRESTTDPEIVEELADVLGCLFGFAIKCHMSLEQIEEALVKKLHERFETLQDLPQTSSVGVDLPICSKCGKRKVRILLMGAKPGEEILACPYCNIILEGSIPLLSPRKG